MSTDTTPHNGWSNVDTYLIANHLMNDAELLLRISEITTPAELETILVNALYTTDPSRSQDRIELARLVPEKDFYRNVILAELLEADFE